MVCKQTWSQEIKDAYYSIEHEWHAGWIDTVMAEIRRPRTRQQMYFALTWKIWYKIAVEEKVQLKDFFGAMEVNYAHEGKIDSHVLRDYLYRLVSSYTFTSLVVM
jgi:hypothetical protein